MNLSSVAYNALLHSVGLGVFPYLRSKSRHDPVFWMGRRGHYPAKVPGNPPRIWFHASSVGEMTGAVPTIVALAERLPEASVTVTAGTPQGFRYALSKSPPHVRVLPFPLDFPGILKRAFDALQPDLYAGFEGEFWPNLYHALARARVPALLLNGRLSKRSARRYQLFSPLFRPIFQHFQWLAMHSEEDRRNVLTLDVSPERVLVFGSSKYGGLLTKADSQGSEAWRKLLNIPEGVPVVVGGSLRRSECTRLLEVFLSLVSREPGIVGVFAPRHMDRVPAMVQWLEDHGIPHHLLSSIEQGKEIRRHRVVLVDRIGILFELYSLGDLIFCGGTMEPIGGHNILEPAAWKKAVFYGPHLHKVLHEHNILTSWGGSFLARDARDLEGQWVHWIKNIEVLESHGARAHEALRSLGGVAEKQVELILNTLAGVGISRRDRRCKS